MYLRAYFVYTNCINLVTITPFHCWLLYVRYLRAYFVSIASILSPPYCCITAPLNIRYLHAHFVLIVLILLLLHCCIAALIYVRYLPTHFMLITSILLLPHRYIAHRYTSSIHILTLFQLHQSCHCRTITLYYIAVLLYCYIISPTYIKWLVIYTLILQSIASHFYIPQFCHHYIACYIKIMPWKNSSIKVIPKPKKSLHEKQKFSIYWAKFEIQLIVKWFYI